MLKNYLKISLRNLQRHKAYSFINIAGLAIGLACFTLIILYVQDEWSYDRYHENADQVYRLAVEIQASEGATRTAQSPPIWPTTLLQAYPEVAAAVRLKPPSQTWMVRYEDRSFSEKRWVFADSSVFDVFDVPLVRGDPKTALNVPFTVVVSEAMVEKYFGGDDPLGKTITIDSQYDFAVTGVFENVPSNSHVHFDFLASFVSMYDPNQLYLFNALQGQFPFSYTYLKLEEGVTQEAFQAKLPGFVEEHVPPRFWPQGAEVRAFLQPLSAIHLHSHLENEIEANGDASVVYIFLAIAVFILLIACVNFMNLATARSAGRAKEVGMRKALGSSRAQLVRQFLTESTLLAFLATVLAVGLVVLLLPSFNTLAGKEISAAFLGTAPVVLGLMALAVMVGFLAGSYPAFYLSAFRPATVLKGTIQAGKRRSLLRDGLVVFQFAISIGLIAGTLVVYNQLNYVRTKTLGFDKEHVVVIQRAQELDDQTTAFKQELLTHSAVVSVSSVSSMPGGLIGQTAYQPEGASGNETFIMAPVFADFDYARTLGMEIALGRDVSRDFATDTTVYLINEAAVKALDWEDPLGKHLVQIGATQSGAFNGEVVGVLKDFHFASLHQEIGALTVRVFEGPLPFIAVRIRPDDIPGVLSFMEEKWRTFAPDQPFEYSFLDQDFDALYQAEQRLGKIFIAFAIFAILIACLGLFGLASFTAEQRTKEIGVRKVLGASVPQLVVLLSKEFTLLVVIAFVIAAPLSFFAMKDWLAAFAYHANIGLEIFVLAGVLALVIAWLTVSYQSIRAAMANPVDSLRYE